MSQVANDISLDNAFAIVRAKKIDAHHNDDFWHLAHHWNETKVQIIQELKAGKYHIAPVKHIYSSEAQMMLSVFTAQDQVVLKALSVVIEKRAKSSLGLRNVMHMKGHGGLKAAVNLAKRHVSQGAYIYKTDIKDYYKTIDHEILLNQLKKITKRQNIVREILMA